MSATSREQAVIVFDNLMRPTDVVGELTQVKAKAIQPSGAFVNSNAAGLVRQVGSLEEMRKCAKESGERLRAMLTSI